MEKRYHNLNDVKPSLEELLARYQEADIQAFDLFYEKVSPLIFNFLIVRLRRHQDAEDALQEVFYRIHKYIARFDASQSALGWIFQIARNVAVDCLRKQCRDTQFDEDMNGPAYDPRMIQDAKDTLESLLAVLTPEERTLIERRYMEDASYEALASEQSITEQSARKRVSRIMGKLKALVGSSES